MKEILIAQSVRRLSGVIVIAYVAEFVTGC